MQVSAMSEIIAVDSLMKKSTDANGDNYLP
jgi:hypothetical protein